MVFSRVERAELIEVENLDDTSRGAGGFGHTECKGGLGCGLMN